MKLDACTRMIAGCQIKNKGKGVSNTRATKAFKVSGATNENGPWEALVQDELVDTSRGEAASLLNFTFEQPIELQYLRFELVSYWGVGGGLQYFAAIPASEHKLKWPRFSSFRGTKTGTWGAQIKLLRPLFNTTSPQNPHLDTLVTRIGP